MKLFYRKTKFTWQKFTTGRIMDKTLPVPGEVIRRSPITGTDSTGHVVQVELIGRRIASQPNVFAFS
ncbi:MAG TPA: hypothetical protein VIH22_09940 [Cyclobacteriaceae bacterium]|jgi:hypothetical protein